MRDATLAWHPFAPWGDMVVCIPMALAVEKAGGVDEFVAGAARSGQMPFSLLAPPRFCIRGLGDADDGS